MTDNRTTELRKLLDKRGVEWMDDSYAQLWCTVWNGHDGKQWRMTENYSGMLTELKAWHVTPEQAIAATLGNERDEIYNAGFDSGIQAVFQQLEGIESYEELQDLIAEYWGEGEGNDER